MNELTIILGAALTAFIFINFFVRSWVICIAVVILGIGVLVAMPDPKNVYLFLAVAVVAVGQVLALIVAKHNNP
jgi:hypothetical protein